MNTFGVVFTTAGLAAALVQLVYAGSIWRRAKGPPPPAVPLLLAGSLWVAAQTAEPLLPTLGAKIASDALQYVGFTSLPVAWIVFCLRYAKRPALKGLRTILLVSIVPALCLLLAFTNPLHGIMWDPEIRIVGMYLHKSRHAGFWVLIIYSYALIVAGGIVLGRPLLVRKPGYGRQVWAFLAAALCPFAASIVDLFRPTAFSGMDVTPLAFSITSLIVVYGFARLQFRERVPVAHRTTVETMRDPVIVADDEGRLLYLNPAAEATLHATMPRVKGAAMAVVCPALPLSVDAGLREPGRQAEIVLEGRFYLTSVSPLEDWQGETVGLVAVLRDVTPLRESERRLGELASELEGRVRDRTAELEREVRERTDAQEKLARSLREQEALLHELHHRVKNNLQVITSLLSLQASRITDAAAAQVFSDSLSRIRAISSMHDMLQWPDSGLRAGEYLRAIAAMALASYGAGEGRITLFFAAEEITLSNDQLVLCGLIVNELVSNALKHAFPEGRRGTVRVSLAATGSRIELAVGDDGVGFPEGAASADAATLGLRIVEALARQLGGGVGVERARGTTVTVHFGGP